MVYLKIKKSNWNQNSSINLQNSERELKGTIQCVYQESIMGIELKQYNFLNLKKKKSMSNCHLYSVQPGN